VINGPEPKITPIVNQAKGDKETPVLVEDLEFDSVIRDLDCIEVVEDPIEFNPVAQVLKQKE
jgi:hypothetical protein